MKANVGATSQAQVCVCVRLCYHCVCDVELKYICMGTGYRAGDPICLTKCLPPLASMSREIERERENMTVSRFG